MTTPAAILHALAGSPKQDGCAELPAATRCWICAAPAMRGVPVESWGSANYTDQNKARAQDSDHVCEPCVWSMSWVSPPGYVQTVEAAAKKAAKRAERVAAGERVGDERPVSIRLFSHLYNDRGYLHLNKASKPQILEWLRYPKHGAWFAAIADTGQKHVLPWTPLNHGPRGGIVRFEERNVALPATADGWRICDWLVDMLTRGVTKTEIESGDYAVRSLQDAETAAVVRAFETEHGARLRGSAWFELSLWLSQRDEEAHGRRRQEEQERREQTKRADRSHREGRAGAARKLPQQGRRQRAEALADAPRPNADGGADLHERRGVGDADAAEAPATDAEQLALFGDR